MTAPFIRLLERMHLHDYAQEHRLLGQSLSGLRGQYHEKTSRFSTLDLIEVQSGAGGHRWLVVDPIRTTKHRKEGRAWDQFHRMERAWSRWPLTGSRSDDAVTTGARS